MGQGGAALREVSWEGEVPLAHPAAASASAPPSRSSDEEGEESGDAAALLVHPPTPPMLAEDTVEPVELGTDVERSSDDAATGADNDDALAIAEGECSEE